MAEIIAADIPFKKIECHTADAIEVFREQGMFDKIELLKKYGKLLCACTLAVTVTLTGSSSIAVHATEQKLEDTKGKLNELQII